MGGSIWSDTLAEFRDKAGGTDPVPAGVSISAVTASLALSLIAKVLRIKRADTTLLDAVKLESKRLAQLADRDIRAFERYMDCVRSKQPKDDAMREAIRVPMDAARSAMRGIELCREATAVFSTGLTAADLGAAACLLRGAAQAMLLGVESNLTHLPDDDLFRQEIVSDLSELKSVLSAFEHNTNTETRTS
jgi:formiminotetrahydrofolate cyclodeaminase